MLMKMHRSPLRQQLIWLLLSIFLPLHLPLYSGLLRCSLLLTSNYHAIILGQPAWSYQQTFRRVSISGSDLRCERDSGLLHITTQRVVISLARSPLTTMAT